MKQSSDIDYVVAIPSYNRPDIVKEKTLAMLRRLRCDQDRITVFCASKAEAERYSDCGAKVVVGVKGLGAQRAFIQEHYPPGTKIISIDDDIEDIEAKVDDKTLQPFRGTLDDIAAVGFGQAEAAGVKFWGIMLVRNPLFMKQDIVVGLRYIGGGFTGSIAGHTTHEHDRPSHGEDFAATLASYTQDGGVMRINWLVLKTGFFSEGGIDTEAKEEGKTRMEMHEAELRRIQERYPELATVKIKAGGIVNLRLKDITTTRIAREAVDRCTLPPGPPNHTGAPLRLTEELQQGETPFSHPASQIELLARVIELVGFRANVVVTARDRKTIVTGNLIWLAAKSRGWKVPCEVQKFRSKAAEEAHILSDYRTAQYSSTAYDKVMGLLEGLAGREPERAGFRLEQINALFGLSEPIAGSEDPSETPPDNRHESIQTLQFLFTDEQLEEFRERMRALEAETGKDNFSEALLAKLEKEKA